MSDSKASLPDAHNFTHTYSVVLDHPIDVVFPVLAHGDGMGRVVRLSDMCANFELLAADTVLLPHEALLSRSTVRGLPSAGSEASLSDLTDSSPTNATRTLPRQAFLLEESVPVLGGLLSHRIRIHGTQTWDSDARVMLYESIAPMGVRVWKLRAFEEVPVDSDVENKGEPALQKTTARTRVTETIKGHAPALLLSTVMKQTARGHRAHMDLYRTLFDYQE